MGYTQFNQKADRRLATPQRRGCTLRSLPCYKMCNALPGRGYNCHVRYACQYRWLYWFRCDVSDWSRCPLFRPRGLREFCVYSPGTR